MANLSNRKFTHSIPPVRNIEDYIDFFNYVIERGNVKLPQNNYTFEKWKKISNIKKYSHLHGLQPRLGFFLDTPKRIPFDFHEVLSLITPRPLFIIVPELDWDNVQSDVIYCVDEVRKIYSLMNAEDKLGLLANYDINRWTTYYNPKAPQKEVFEWIEKMFK